MNGVEKVVYINLASRPDRKASIERELSFVPASKIARFDAIVPTGYYNNGAFGCSMSHIAVLDLAIENGWGNCLILEDDAVWNRFEEGDAVLARLMARPYDVILLGAIGAHDGETYKATDCQTSHAYLVSKHYYTTLRDHMREGLRKHMETGDGHRYMIDMYWKLLQARDNWYAIFPVLMYQRTSHSDIQNRVMDTADLFGVSGCVTVS